MFDAIVKKAVSLDGKTYRGGAGHNDSKVVSFDKNGYCTDEYGVAYGTMEGWGIRPAVIV